MYLCFCVASSAGWTSGRGSLHCGGYRPDECAGGDESKACVRGWAAGQGRDGVQPCTHAHHISSAAVCAQHHIRLCKSSWQTQKSILYLQCSVKSMYFYLHSKFGISKINDSVSIFYNITFFVFLLYWHKNFFFQKPSYWAVVEIDLLILFCMCMQTSSQCVMHLEDRLQELYFKSRSLAEYLRGQTRVRVKELGLALG